MIRALAFITVVAGLLLFPASHAAPAVPPRAAISGVPVGVIFDTDMWSDIDDMLALAMLNVLHDRREINLLAVTSSTQDPWTASYIDLVDTFYGHAKVPIGLVRNGVRLTVFRERFPEETWPPTRYTQIISERKNKDGTLMYPHRLVDGNEAPDALLVLRKTLAAQPDGSVVMIQVGFSTNLARLLDTKGDATSPLGGVELVAKKVRMLSLMGGCYSDLHYANETLPKGAPEFNLKVDVPAAQKLFSTWPTPIVASGLEVGFAMWYSGSTIGSDYGYVLHHPIADTYRTYCEEMKSREHKIDRCPQDHDHATFDLTSVLYAARPDRGYFSLSKPGTITVLADGGSRFDEAPNGKHRFLILSEVQRARTLEAMMLLASEPPRVR